jgi:hypothetical protein
VRKDFRKGNASRFNMNLHNLYGLNAFSIHLKSPEI